MNNFLFGLIFSGLSCSFFLNRNNPIEKPVSLEKDFFENPQYIKASWLGYLPSSRTNKSISNIPMFIYRNSQTAYAKIICIPVRQTNWNAKFKGKTTAQKTVISRTLAKGIINHSFSEKQFTIYALVQQSSGKKGIRIDKNNNLILYPATVYIYKNVGKKWNNVAKKIVANSVTYQQLQYDVANASLNAISI